jgi:hypothetical protein
VGVTRAPELSTVHLSIDRFVVEGFSRLDARRVHDGFTERLQQLAAAAPRALDGLISGERADTPALAVDGDQSPREVGRSAAEALWGELTR